MTTESAAPAVLHPWAIYLRASEEARRRGDRRTGTDHVLLAVVFLPFPTRLVADALTNTGHERVYVTMYGLTLLAIRLLGSLLDAYARYEHLYSPAGEDEELQSTQRKTLPAVIGYLIAIYHRAPSAGSGSDALRRSRGVSGGAVPRGHTSADPAS